MSAHDKDVVARWKTSTVFDLTAGSGASIVTDGDAKAGMSPMDLVLAALAGCSGADVIDILRKKRQSVSQLEVWVHGDRCQTHPRVYTAIHLKYVLTGREIDTEALRRAIELSENKYCSVSAMLRASATLTIGFEIHEAKAVAVEPRSIG